MAAEGLDDCEGDILSHARAIAPEAVIGAELDPHCHLTASMVEAADLILIAREYPHIDFDVRAADLYRLALATARGEIRPTAALIDTRMLGFYPTFDPPMKDVVASLRAMSGQGGVITAELAHGFPWGDVADIGTRVLVYADGDGALAAREAERIAGELYDQRRALSLNLPTIGASLERARGLNGRTVLGDFADNPGGGAPGDSTFFLRALVEQGVDDAVIGAFWDPQMAQVCVDAGVGAVVPLRIGGKCGPDFRRAGGSDGGSDGDRRTPQPGRLRPAPADGPLGRGCGPAASTSFSARSGPRCSSPTHSRALACRWRTARLIIVKSSNHYRAGFDGIADQLWHVASPGAISLDFSTVPYTRMTGPIFPLAEDPWTRAGRPKARVFEAK